MKVTVSDAQLSALINACPRNSDLIQIQDTESGDINVRYLNQLDTLQIVTLAENGDCLAREDFRVKTV